MSVTIPRAGVQAGRAAQIRVHEPQVGAAFADFGNVLVQQGRALEQDRLDRQSASDRLGLTQKFEQLRLQAEQIGDPDQLDQFWRENVGRERETYLANVDPRLRPNAENDFDSLAIPHGTAVGRQQLGLINDQRLATYSELRDATVRQAANMDPATAAELFARQDAELERMIGLGLVGADRRLAEQQGYRTEAEGARATRMLSTNPTQLREAIDAGEFTAMDPQAQEGWRARALSTEAAEAARQAAAAKVAHKEFLTEAKGTLRSRTGAYRLGRDIPDQDAMEELIASDPELAASEEAEEFKRARILYREMPGFAAQPLSDKRALRDSLKAEPIETPDANRVLQAVEEDIAAHEKALNENFWGYAKGIGVAEAAELPAFDSADPSAFRAALQARGVKADALEDEGYSDGPIQIFTPEEVTALAPLAEASASPQDRARLAASLAGLPLEQAKIAAEQLKAEPSFVFLGGGLAANALDETMIRQTFEGQRLREGKMVAVPTELQMRTFVADTFGDMFGDGTAPGTADQRSAMNGLLDAALSRYAWLNRQADPTDKDFNETLMLRAVNDIAGQTPDGKGGFHEVRGRQTLVPPGMTGSDIESGLKLVDWALDSNSMPESDWQLLSPSGTVPKIAGQTPDRSTMQRVWVQPFQDGYVLMADVPDQDYPQMVRDDAGNPWLLDPARFADLDKARSNRLKEWRAQQPAAVQAVEQEKARVERTTGAGKQERDANVAARMQRLQQDQDRKAFEAEVRATRRQQPSLSRAAAERAVHIDRLAKSEGLSLRDAAREYDRRQAPQPRGDNQ